MRYQIRKWNVVVLIIIISITGFSGCNFMKEKKYETQFLDFFDTVTLVSEYADSQKEFNDFSDFIYNKLEHYHKIYDIYNTYEGINNICTINENAGIKPVKVDQDIVDMLLFSKEAYQLSNGKVNIALGSVLSIWHDYRTAGMENPDDARLPDMELLTEAAKHTDINQMIIDEEASTVYLEDKDMSLDVGAIAKGYATEQVCQLALAEGFTSGLISVGGNVRAIGAKDKEQNPWIVGIQNPDLNEDNSFLYALNLTDLSLVTSGTYQRYYVVDGKQYHHIIDPETLMPSAYFTAVSIICKDSGLADVLSTALFNMSYEQGIKLIDSLKDAEAIWIYQNGDIKYSDGFEAMIHKE